MMVALVAALVAFVLWAAGLPTVFVGLVGGGVFFLADRLGLIAGPFEPSVQDFLKRDEESDSGRKPPGK
jgi:hypothetical protein